MLYFILIYLCVVIIYFEKNRKNSLINLSLFLMAICIPIFGLIVAIIYNSQKVDTVVYEFEEEREKESDDLDNFLLKNSHSNFEANLILKSFKEARKEIVNFNKLSIDESSKLYVKALNSDDTEVSHMAAASLMKVKQTFEKELNITDDVQIENLKKYIFTLGEAVKNGLVIGALKNNLIVNAVNFAEKYIKFQNDDLEYFLVYIKLLLEIENYDLALAYANYITNKWSYNEKSWFANFEVLLKAKMKTILTERIIEYKNNNFEESEEMTSFISFWR